MITEIFNTTNDFELSPNTNINRKSTYLINNAKKNNGIIVYIPGFGGDLGEYTKKFCMSISDKYPTYSTMSVEYFCMRSRPQVGASISFEIEDKIKYGINDINISPKEFIYLLNEKAKADNIQMRVTGTLNPPNNEYQNFGLMAAIDILNGIMHAINKYALNEDDIILVGSSYGGYLANLVTKLYPGYIRAVFDNSSWAKPKMNYLVGRELFSPEFIYQHDMLNVELFVKSPWTIKNNLPNSIEGGKLSIRSFSNDDLDKMYSNGGNKTIYFFCHAKEDFIANTAEKLEMAKAMINRNFIVRMDIFDENDIDGEFIKSMDHGMGLSMLKFFDKAYDFLSTVTNEVSFENKKINNIEYKYENSSYFFDLSKKPILSRYYQQ